MKLCTPALIYLVLSVIALFLGAKMFTIMHIIGILLWTFILNYLCSIGYTTISWILVLLPLIFMFFVAFSMTTIVLH
jgi:hypothetical protein